MLLNSIRFVLVLALGALIISKAQAAGTAPQYCVAVRGNGELMPAHWGAMAKAIETFGAFEGMAGGSSGSITTFFWESMMANPKIQQQSAKKRAQILALLFKSLEGIVDLQFEQKQWKNLISLLQLGQSDEGRVALQQALAHLVQDQVVEKLTFGILPNRKTALEEQILKAINTLKDSRVFYGPAVVKVAASLEAWKKSDTPENQKKLKEHLTDLKKTIDVFGKFDAKNDKQIFIRDGLVNFSALADAFAIVADAFSLRNANSDDELAFSKFIQDCASTTVGKSWSEIATKGADQSPSQCAVNLSVWFQGYIKHHKKAGSRIDDNIGQFAKVISSTAVIQGKQSMNRFKDIKMQYEASHDPSLGGDKQMQVPSEDLAFGYWGSTEDLQTIAQNLKPNTDKSKRFKSLGQATWKQVLSLSPAEPGLSPFIEFTSVSDKERLLSIGGWSDLHPVPVLRAMGCEKVVYLTRRGGDSLFGIGIAKRMLGLDEISWDFLDTIDPDKKAENNKRNMNGSETDMNSQWSKMFNVQNTQSSFAYSLAQADAVVCTEWNAFAVPRQFHQIIEQAYKSPVILQSKLPADFKAAPDGYPIYTGCIPSHLLQN